MKGLELLSLTQEQKKLLEASELNYRRFAGIYFAVLSINDKEAIIKVWQNENPTGNYLDKKELNERVKEVFAPVLPDGVSIHSRPIPFKGDGLDNYSIEKIEADMAELSLQPKDLVKLLDIDKSSLSRLLTGGRELTKHQKAMFYYLFKYLKSR